VEFQAIRQLDQKKKKNSSFIYFVKKKNSSFFYVIVIINHFCFISKMLVVKGVWRAEGEAVEGV
jgi:hypothetical protein